MHSRGAPVCCSDSHFCLSPGGNHYPDFRDDNSVVTYLFYLMVLPLTCRHDSLCLKKIMLYVFFYLMHLVRSLLITCDIIFHHVGHLGGGCLFLAHMNSAAMNAYMYCVYMYINLCYIPRGSEKLKTVHILTFNI